MKALLSSAKDKTVYPWVYFHGSLEVAVGFDLVCLESGKLVPGRQAVTVKVLVDGKDKGIDAEAFLFYDRFDRLRGLVVDSTNEEDYQFAIDTMNTKPITI